MLIKIIIAFFVFIFPCYAVQGSEAEDECLEYIISYQNNYSSSLYYRKARVDHLIEMLRGPTNKYKLINDIYLHYYLIDSVRSEMSLVLEKCLLKLLNITYENSQLAQALKKRNLSFLSKSNKMHDPVNKIFEYYIVNSFYFEDNKEKIYEMQILSEKEKRWFGSSIAKVEFDQIFNFDVGKPNNPEILTLLSGAYRKIMEVFYEGHYIFNKYNIKCVQDFVDLLRNSPEKNSLKAALKIYKQSPSVELFHDVKVKVRSIYQGFSQEPLGLSASEVWHNLFEIAQEIAHEVDDENRELSKAIAYIKRIYDSNNVILARSAAEEIIGLLSAREDARERIRYLF